MHSTNPKKFTSFEVNPNKGQIKAKADIRNRDSYFLPQPLRQNDKMTEYKNKERLWFIWLIGNPITDSKEAVKESFELVNHRLLFLGSGTATAKSGHRRHQFIDIRSGGFDFAITEGVLQELSDFSTLNSARHYMYIVVPLMTPNKK